MLHPFLIVLNFVFLVRRFIFLDKKPFGFFEKSVWFYLTTISLSICLVLYQNKSTGSMKRKNLGKNRYDTEYFRIGQHFINY